jgi:hypothetical protein
MNKKIIHKTPDLGHKAISISEDIAIAFAGIIALIFEQETCPPVVSRGFTSEHGTRFTNQTEESLTPKAGNGRRVTSAHGKAIVGQYFCCGRMNHPEEGTVILSSGEIVEIFGEIKDCRVPTHIHFINDV